MKETLFKIKSKAWDNKYILVIHTMMVNGMMVFSMERGFISRIQIDIKETGYKVSDKGNKSWLVKTKNFTYLIIIKI